MIQRKFMIYSSAVLHRCRNTASLGHHNHEQPRFFVTAAQKRVVNEGPIAGTSASTPKISTAPPSDSTGIGAAQTLTQIPLALAVTGLGIYLLDTQDVLSGIRQTIGFPKEGVVVPHAVIAAHAVIEAAQADEPKKKQQEQKLEAIIETRKEIAAPIMGQQPPTKVQETERGVSVDHMAAVGFAVSIVNPDAGSMEQPSAIAHPKSGNRVAVESLQQSRQPAAAAAETSQLSLKEELGIVVPLPSPISSTTNLADNLEKLSVKELRDKIYMLSLELDHRTNWEGIRMAQFRHTLEQELSHKHMEELHKQRLAFEELLSKRVHQVEDTTERRAQALLSEKEQEVEQLMEAAKFTLSQEHEAEMQAELENWNREYNASLQKEVAKRVTEVKEQYAKELSEKVEILNTITQKLEFLEQYAEMSRTYEESSKSAHKISAAALALATKLESTGKNAVAEIQALRKALTLEEDTTSGTTSGIYVALEQLPQDVWNGARVPTVSELQTNFSVVKRRARAASKVPEGKRGLGAQLFSYAFSAITVEPDPEHATISKELADYDQNYPDLVLARAGKFVQLGDLETAVAELNGLKGQAAFTVKDWKQDATNRVMVNRMLKVIKMECAMLNESFCG